jgi:hypothetical protein
MKFTGHVQNGVVVLEGEISLPEGAAVTVVYSGRVAKPARGIEHLRVQFPLIRSAQPGSIDLTNDRIAEILDDEDAAPGR